jgi:hypothetical protein
MNLIKRLKAYFSPSSSKPCNKSSIAIGVLVAQMDQVQSKLISHSKYLDAQMLNHMNDAADLQKTEYVNAERHGLVMERIAKLKNNDEELFGNIDLLRKNVSVLNEKVIMLEELGKKGTKRTKTAKLADPSPVNKTTKTKMGKKK